MKDSDLLKRYVEEGCEEAFSELTQRHVDLVFSAALRQVNGDRHLAEDVTQMVFSDLARKAGSLRRHEVLSGWLYTSARFAACKKVRTETRRREREENAMKFLEGGEEEGPVNWEELEPALDEAMHELEEGDRNAILWRFFEGRPLVEVGTRLGLTADAARMRVERAIEKLRKALRGRGILTGSAGLAVLLAQQATTAAPVGLGISVAGAALASAGVAAKGGAAAAILEVITMSKITTAVAVVVIAGMSVPLVMQQRTKGALEETNRGVTQRLATAEDQLAALAADNSRLSNLVARTSEAGRGNEEVIQLRAEVAKFRAEKRMAPAVVAREGAVDPLQQTLQTLGARATQLRARLEQSPEKWIPELALLKERNWLDAVGSLTQLESDEDFRQAMNQLRIQGKSEFGSQIKKALQKFADANDGMLPVELGQLQAYIEGPIDAAMLQRYKLTKAGYLNDVPRDQSIVDEIATPVDEEYDTLFRFHRNGTSSTSYSKIGTEIENAAIQFARANNGLLPRQPDQVAAYLKQGIDAQRVQKFLAKIPANVTTLEQYQNR